MIITDNEFLPSLMQMRDGTEYVPAEATYAIGEIKSTYSHAARHLTDLCAKLQEISAELARPEIANTYRGTITQHTHLVDILRASNAEVHNRLFSFMICVDAGDYRLEPARTELEAFARQHTPGVVALLNRGILVAGRMNEQHLDYTQYPGTGPLADAPHVLLQPTHAPTGSPAGGVLGFIFATLVDHLNRSYLEPVAASPYLRNLLTMSRRGSEGL